jgi:hypothetical protein
MQGEGLDGSRERKEEQRRSEEDAGVEMEGAG